MKRKKQIRSNFKLKVFTRDGHKCVICQKPAVDAHHIIDRSLWPNGGYYMENGVSLCDEHHKEAEASTISCKTLREAAGIYTTLIPNGFDPTKTYDKWGKEIYI